MHKNLFQLCTPIVKQQKENIRKTIPFTRAPKAIRYLGRNPIKELKALYSEKYKTLMKKLKKIQRNGKILHALGLEEQILLKCLHYTNQSKH